VALLEPSVAIHIPMLAMLEPGDDAPVIVDLKGGDGTPAAAQGLWSGSREFETLGDVVDSWRRKSGIPRPSSAARASVAAATVCRPLVEAGGWDRARLGVVTASTSSAAWSAVNFETRGLAEGWDLVDPLLLPSTLPSALATQVAAAVGARGFAFSFLVGLLGVFHAIEAAMIGLARGDADAVLVVVAEEQTFVQRAAHELLGWEPTPGEFAGALVLERDTGRGHRVGFLGQGDPAGPVVPEGWVTSPRYEVRSEHRGPSLRCSAAFRVIGDALLAQQPRAVVIGSVPGLGYASLGVEVSRRA
jgi:hypothetical protein